MPAVTTENSSDCIEASLRASLEASSGGGYSLEEKILSSAVKVLLTKIEYCPAEKPYTSMLKSLQSKYINLQRNSDNDSVKSSEEKNGFNGSDLLECEWRESDDGIAVPRVVIHPLDNVKLGWLRVYKIGAGLANMGNTCFLNATLQCLTYTPPLVNHLIEFNEHSATCKNVGFCMMCELQRHIRRQLDKNGDVIRPHCILQKLRSIAAHMTWGRQEDAHEFLRYVMDSMVNSSLNGYTTAKLDRISFETTVVNQIFGGYHRSQVICLRCRSRSDTYDHFLDIMLDIKNVSSLEKAMENFVQPELLDSENAYMCPNCKQKCPAKKRFTIHRAPNIATFQLKRFDYSRSFGGKITKHVTFPEKFDMRPCMSQKQGPSIMYLLYAVLVHQGPSCNSGHYFCFVRNSNNLWYLMDDTKVRQVALNVVLSQQAYLLFYTRNPNNGHLLKNPLPRMLPVNAFVNNAAGISESPGFMRKPITVASNSLKPKNSLTSNSTSTANHKPSSSLSAAARGGCAPPPQPSSVDNSKSQQRHPRIVMHIKNGKVYSCQESWSSKAGVSAATTSSSSCPPSSLVPYAPDSSEESDQDAGRLGQATVSRTTLPTASEEGSASRDDGAGGNNSNDDNVSAIASSPSAKVEGLANGICSKKRVDFDSPQQQQLSSLSVGVVGSTKVNATSQWLVVEDSGQQSPPSVASSDNGSNISVNSTTEWKVTDVEAAAAAATTNGSKVDREYNGWTVVDAAKRRSDDSSSSECTKAAEVGEERIISSAVNGEKDVVESLPKLIKPSTSREGLNRDETAAGLRGMLVRDGDKLPIDNCACKSNGDDRRHKKRKRGSSSRRQNKEAGEEDESKGKRENASSRKRKRHSSESSGSGDSYELEWVEKTKETIEGGGRRFVVKPDIATYDRKTGCVVRKEDGGDDDGRSTTNGSASVAEMLKSCSGVRGYGGNVLTWDGQQSSLERSLARDRQRCSNDDYDEELDRGRTKKVKKRYSNEQFADNPFQLLESMHKDSRFRFKLQSLQKSSRNNHWYNARNDAWHGNYYKVPHNRHRQQQQHSFRYNSNRY